MTTLADRPSAAPATVDPVTVEIVRNAFIAAAEEMNINLARSAYTPIIYEMKDCSVALFNERVELLGQANGLPLFVGALDAAVQATVDAVGRARMRPGDLYLLNDSYLTGSHLNDMTVLSPVFWQEALVGFAVSKAHWIDIGAMDAGVTVRATEIYQEGLRIGPTKLIDAGVLREDLLDLFARHSRLPYAIKGDLQAQIAACRTGERRYQALLDRFGRATLEAATAAIFAQSERADRAALAALPDGVYTADGFLDNDGHTDEPLPVRVTVTIADETMTIDLAGSAGQRAACVNAGFPYTVSAARLAFKFLFNPETPVNGGAFRTLTVLAPPRTIFHAQEPAPTQRAAPCLGLLIDLVIRALAPIMPERVAANQCADPMNLYLTGTEPRTGRRFVSGDALGVGWGGHVGGDGESALINYGGGDLKNYPIETVEQRTPVLVRRFGLDPDSGGAGQWRGGLGLVRELEILTDDAELSLWFERSVTPGLGLFGGSAGSRPRVLIDPETDHERCLLKVNHLPVPRGTVIRAFTGGGGGYGPPAARDPAAHAADRADGLVTPDAAARDDA